MDYSKVAKQLGKNGGQKTAKRGKDYYKRIGKLGLEKRYKSKSDTKQPEALLHNTK